ncbi:MAG: hypothetical protein HY056_14265 [Proteobacteria bacterium]|nr:hypothetical protein [Pseudomonadota bacterium]
MTADHNVMAAPCHDGNAAHRRFANNHSTLAIGSRGDFTVNFSMPGFLPQAVSARLILPDDPRGDAELSSQSPTAVVTPNPIFAVLERAPPPPPPARSRRRQPAADPPRSPAPLR